MPCCCFFSCGVMAVGKSSKREAIIVLNFCCPWPRSLSYSALFISKCHRGFRDSPLWKMEQDKLFSTSHFSFTRRLESEGGALWRKHSCSGHLYASFNLHCNHTMLWVGWKYFLLHATTNCSSSRIITLMCNRKSFRWRCAFFMQVNKCDKGCRDIFIHLSVISFNRAFQASSNKTSSY